jgi:type IX secretion system PorP/SprF family membrane protein
MNTRALLSAIIIGFTLLAQNVSAQQEPAYSMYFFNPMHFNPAYAGSREVFSGTLVHRSQWVRVPGSPVSQSLNIHSRLPDSRVALGLQAFNDQAGPMKNTGLGLTFAYHIPMNDKVQLAFGITGSMSNVRVGFNELMYEEEGDPSFVNNRDANWVPDADAGLYLYSERFFAGLSAKHLIQSRFNMTDANGANLARFWREYYATGGVVIPIGANVNFRPSALVRFLPSAPVMTEIDAAFIFNERLFIGAGYRGGKRIDFQGVDNVIVGMIEFEITSFLRAGYSYDFYANRDGAYNSGTHELMIGWDLTGRGKDKVSSPRFF